MNLRQLLIAGKYDLNFAIIVPNIILFIIPNICTLEDLAEECGRAYLLIGSDIFPLQYVIIRRKKYLCIVNWHNWTDLCYRRSLC